MSCTLAVSTPLDEVILIVMNFMFMIEGVIRVADSYVNGYPDGKRQDPFQP